MESEQKKAILRKHKRNISKLQNIKDRYETLYNSLIDAKATRITDMPTSGEMRADKIPCGISMLEEFSKMQSDIMQEIIDVEMEINTLERQEYLDIVRLKYLEDKNWQELESIMQIGKTSLWKMHGEVLKQLFKDSKRWTKVNEYERK